MIDTPKTRLNKEPAVSKFPRQEPEIVVWIFSREGENQKILAENAARMFA
jgi:hypothetical protein